MEAIYQTAEKAGRHVLIQPITWMPTVDRQPPCIFTKSFGFPWWRAAPHLIFKALRKSHREAQMILSLSE
ncbi:hypothetical protein ASC97_31550 [Rhizobium sp. Root1203]|nr:hypothetical protein ASC97_31550 [Rhizobium sp. Root1203]